MRRNILRLMSLKMNTKKAMTKTTMTQLRWKASISWTTSRSYTVSVKSWFQLASQSALIHVNNTRKFVWCKWTLILTPSFYRSTLRTSIFWTTWAKGSKLAFNPSFRNSCKLSILWIICSKTLTRWKTSRIMKSKTRISILPMIRTQNQTLTIKKASLQHWIKS